MYAPTFRKANNKVEPAAVINTLCSPPLKQLIQVLRPLTQAFYMYNNSNNNNNNNIDCIGEGV